MILCRELRGPTTLCRNHVDFVESSRNLGRKSNLFHAVHPAPPQHSVWILDHRLIVRILLPSPFRTKLPTVGAVLRQTLPWEEYKRHNGSSNRWCWGNFSTSGLRPKNVADIH